MKLAAIFKKKLRNQDNVFDLRGRPPNEGVIYSSDLPSDAEADLSQAQAAAVLHQTIPGMTSSLDHFIEGSEADFMLLGIGLRTVHANVTELTELMLGYSPTGGIFI